MQAAVKAERAQAAAKEQQESAGSDVTSPVVHAPPVKGGVNGAAGAINGKHAVTTGSAAEPAASPERTTYPGPAAEDEITQWLGTSGKPQAALEPSVGPPPAATAKAGAARQAQPRTGAPQTGAREKPARHRPRILLVTLVVAVLVIGSLGVVLTRHTARSSGSGTTSAAQRQAAAVRDQAAAWVAQQVSRNVIVSCDRKMCAALTAHGFPANKLLVLGSTSPYPRSSAVVIQTAAVKDLFGSSLATAWAPVVLASFQPGAAAEITVRLIAPHGTAAYQSALSADLADRKTTGSSLLNDSRIAVSVTAQKQLMAGQVDSRLLLAIASLATDHPIELVGFGNIAPGGDPDVPLRFADLAENDQSAHLTGAGYVKAMRASLATVNIQFRPASRTVTLPGGQTVLRVEFTAPSPLGLLVPQGSS
jgi:hypothetical protein